MSICSVYISFFVRVMILEGHYVIISELGTCVCIYVTVQELHFLIIFCVSYNVCEYVCVLCFNFIYAKVYFVCHTMSVNICVCVVFQFYLC